MLKKELFLFVLLLFFITLINLGTQIQGAQTWYTVVSFGLNQPLIIFHNSLKDTHLHCQLCCTEKDLTEKSFLCENWSYFNLTSFTSVLTWALIKLAEFV